MQLTFLEIVQQAYVESNFTGVAPVSVLNQVGRKADVVKWVLQAFEEIQTARQDWKWDWAQGSFPLVATVDTYDPVADFGIVGGIRQFIRSPNAAYAYPTANGVNSRAFLRFLPWESFRGGNVPPVNGTQPVVFTMRPDGDVQYYPTPSIANTAVHEYYLNPQVLEVDADVPRMPDYGHMAIVWKAVMIGCGKTQNFARFDTAEENYNAIFDRLVRRETPQMTMGDPLA